MATPRLIPDGAFLAYIKIAFSILAGSSQQIVPAFSSVYGAARSFSISMPVLHSTPWTVKEPNSAGASASFHGYGIGCAEFVFVSHTTNVLASPPSFRSLSRSSIFVLVFTKKGRFVHFITNSWSYSLWSMMYLVQLSISATSVPGRIGSQMSALAASGVSRGSIEMVFTPLARSSTSIRPPQAGEL